MSKRNDEENPPEKHPEEVDNSPSPRESKSTFWSSVLNKLVTQTEQDKIMSSGSSSTNIDRKDSNSAETGTVHQCSSAMSIGSQLSFTSSDKYKGGAGTMESNQVAKVLQKELLEIKPYPVLSPEKLAVIAHTRLSSYKKAQRIVFYIVGDNMGWISISYHSFMSIYLLIFVILGLVATLPSMSHLINGLGIAEIVLTAMFLVEYVLKLWSCTCLGFYRHPIKGRLLFALRSWMVLELLINITCIISAVLYLNGMADTQTESQRYGVVSVLRMIRLLKIMRIIANARHRRDPLTMLQDIWHTYKFSFLISFLLSFIIVIFCGFLIYSIEPSGTVYPNAFVGMYWSVITLSTIGYGDIYPTSTGGRILTVVMAWVGIAFFAIPAGILSSAYALKVEGMKASEKEEKKKAHLAYMVIATWWKLRETQARKLPTMVSALRKVARFDDNLGRMASYYDMDIEPSTSVLGIKDAMAVSDSEGDDNIPNPLIKKTKKKGQKLYRKFPNNAHPKKRLGPMDADDVASKLENPKTHAKIIVLMLTYKMKLDESKRNLRYIINNKEADVEDIMEYLKETRVKMFNAMREIRDRQNMRKIPQITMAAHTTTEAVLESAAVNKRLENIESKQDSLDKDLKNIVKLLTNINAKMN